jgi:hypothetical protein
MNARNLGIFNSDGVFGNDKLLKRSVWARISNSDKIFLTLSAFEFNLGGQLSQRALKLPTGRESSMKISNRGFAVIAGLLLFVFAAFVWWKGFPSNYILLSRIVLVGLALTVVFMAVAAIIYSRRENSMKIGNKGFAVIAGLLLLVAAAVMWKYGFPEMDRDNPNPHYMLLSQIVLVGLALTVVFMAILAIIYSVMGVEDAKQALGLPEGSVRALLAFSLVLIFVCLAAFLFGEVNKNNQPVEGKTLTAVTEIQLADLKTNFVVASQLAKDQSGQVQYEQKLGGQDGKTPVNDIQHPLYTVTYYPKGNKDAEDFAKQIFTTLATVFVSVVSFYFGSSVTTSAAAAGARAALGPDGKPSALQGALTNALADSHNAQAPLDKASQALDAARKDAQANPADPQKQAALLAAQKAFDDAKQDLQDKQNKVAAAQKAAGDTDPKAPKPSTGQNA